MKILLKGKDNAKLYKGDLDMPSLVKFIASNLKLEPQHYTLSYRDDEGDEISIVSDADLQTAQELNQGRNFLKINLTPAETMLVTCPTEVSEEGLKKKEQKEQKKEEKEKMREERRLKREERRKTREEKQSSESKEECSSSEDRCKRRLAKFSRMLSRSIS